MAEMEGPVKGDKAVKRMMNRALNPGSSSEEDNDNKDPLKEAIKLKKEMAAVNIIEDTLSPKDKTGSSGGSGPFQVKGNIDLGSFNFQEAITQANQRVEAMQKELKEQLAVSGQVNQQLQEKIHEQQLEILKLTFGAQIDALQKMIQSGANQKSFMDQYNEAMQVAKTLGFQVAGPGTTSSPEIQLQILKIEQDHAIAMKNLEMAAKADDRKWQMDIRRLDEEKEQKEAELVRQRQRDQFFFSTPEAIGGAIARGIIESKGGGGGGIASAAKPARGTKQTFHIEVPPGEGGETTCPNCGETVGIGPTARKAVCPGCSSEFPIRRVGEPQPPAPAAESGERHREVE